VRDNRRDSTFTAAASVETADQKADCIGETKAKVVVPVARAIVVAISATQVGETVY